MSACTIRPTSTFADAAALAVEESPTSAARLARATTANTLRCYLMLSLCSDPMLPLTKTLKAKHHRSSSDSLGSAECITTDGNKQTSLVLGL
jgi:hypothetical protein